MMEEEKFVQAENVPGTTNPSFEDVQAHIKEHLGVELSPENHKYIDKVLTHLPKITKECYSLLGQYFFTKNFRDRFAKVFWPAYPTQFFWDEENEGLRAYNYMVVCHTFGPAFEDLLSNLIVVRREASESLREFCQKFTDSSLDSLRQAAVDHALNYDLADISKTLKFFVHQNCTEPLVNYRSAIAGDVEFSVRLECKRKGQLILTVFPIRHWSTEPLKELLELDFQTPSKKIAPVFLKKHFTAKGETFSFVFNEDCIINDWICLSDMQTFISLDKMESMIDLASYNLRQMPTHENLFAVIPVFQALLPKKIDPQIPLNIVLGSMDEIFGTLCFDSFLSTQFVACPRKNRHDATPPAYLGKNLACDAFLLEMEKADRFDNAFFYKFQHGIDCLSKLVIQISQEKKLQSEYAGYCTAIELFHAFSKVLKSYEHLYRQNFNSQPTSFFSGSDHDFLQKSFNEMKDLHKQFVLTLHYMAKGKHQWQNYDSEFDCGHCGQNMNSVALMVEEKPNVFHYHCALLKGMKKIELIEYESYKQQFE